MGMMWVEERRSLVRKAEVTTEEYIEFKEMLCLSEHMKDFYAAVLCKVLIKRTREMQESLHFDDGEMKTQKVMLAQ